ncbi:ABC transporter family substrate-binding protein [Corynebacterium sp. LK2510]|uniref:ABC transporter family substrate-binding protein n=1 Tax=Corynebacterium sp. LK2510 TaxID=3110472 RepID=UPI0034CDE18B
MKPLNPAPRTPSTRMVCAALLSAMGLSIASCAANPGPPPLVTDPPGERATTTAATPAPTTRTTLEVGVDPLRNGLNPHLASDETETVRAIADLVLPSAFINGERNADLVTAAAVLPVPSSPAAAMTVRYVLEDEAQWSDGTPITGRDFAYLWRGMASTPGVIDPAGYRAISDIRVIGAGGKVVDVDFSAPVAEWRALFTHLLPSHLLSADASDFAVGLRTTIPASAGRFMLVDVDRGRRVIILNRNDRFWGEHPADVDILTLNAVNNTTQVAGQLRGGQLAFADLTPAETTGTVFGLVPGVRTEFVDAPRTLGITLSTTSPLLESMEAREEMRSLIDVPLLASVAAGRSTDLNVAPHRPVSEAVSTVLPELIRTNRPLRVGVDPADAQAAAAARSLVDLLSSRGIAADVVTTDMRSMAAQGLPTGELDMTVNWMVQRGSTPALAGRLYCPPATYRAGNLSGLCTPETEERADAILFGEIPAELAADEVAATLDAYAVWVPLMGERRIRAATDGIVGADSVLQAWPS